MIRGGGISSTGNGDEGKVFFVHRTAIFDRSLDDLRRKGGTASVAAEKADEVIRLITRTEGKGVREQFRFTRKGEYRIKYCRTHDQSAVSQSPEFQFPNKEPCHDRLTSAGIVSQKESYTGEFEQIVVDRLELKRWEKEYLRSLWIPILQEKISPGWLSKQDGRLKSRRRMRTIVSS